MSLYNNLQEFQAQKAHAQQSGRATSTLSNMGYSAEMERALPHLPIMPDYRAALQGADGKFNFSIADDGTRTAGSFYIDSFGRFVSY